MFFHFILTLAVKIHFILSTPSPFDPNTDYLDVLYPDTNEKDVTFVTKCYKDVGCFSTAPPWYDKKYRPNPLPSSDVMHTVFMLYTPQNKEEVYYLEPDKESLSNSNFDGKKMTVVATHGYLVNYTEVEGIKDELLKYYDYNVILVDWSKDNQPPFPQAAMNVRVTGAIIAHLLNFLIKETGLKAKNIHVIGKSLGGQICGFVGKRVKNLGRITALDPAGPYFQYAPKMLHLTKGDARFVQVIHTNGGRNLTEGEGIIKAAGHADFYPNGGNHMPGCDRVQFVNLPVYSDKIGNQCSHGRSVEYFISSIKTCKYHAHACLSYGLHKTGLCKLVPFTNKMGFHAHKPLIPLKYYLDTTAKPPYCEA